MLTLLRGRENEEVSYYNLFAGSNVAGRSGNKSGNSNRITNFFGEESGYH